MQRFCSWLGVLAVVAGFWGCATIPRQPEFQAAGILPAQLKPGDTAVISVTVADRHGIVRRVDGVVLEDPRIKFGLRDDGEAPDVEAGDGIWTLQVDVPFQAPPGEFELSFTAYREDGEPILVRDASGNTVPLTVNFGMAIRFPDPAP